MSRPALSTRRSAGPRATLLALLFLLVTVAAPTVDAWLHADDAAAAQQHSGPDDCVLCRLAATPTAPSAAAEMAIAEMSGELPRFAPVQAAVRAAPKRLTPPTRAPPA